MNCKEIRLYLPWFVNGTLSVDETRDVTAHLVRCRDCREDLYACELLFRLTASASEHRNRHNTLDSSANTESLRARPQRQQFHRHLLAGLAASIIILSIFVASHFAGNRLSMTTIPAAPTHELLFAEDFESGDTGNWHVTAPVSVEDGETVPFP